MTTPDLASYDWIILSSSAGKDSQSMITDMIRQADLLGISRNKLVVVHADLGIVEWKGTRALAEEQAEFYGLRFIAISRPQGNLLQQIEHQRKKFPDLKNRYCTSDQKRGQIHKIYTRLVNETREAENTKRKIKVLDCMGIRAQESPARAKKPQFSFNKSASNGKRQIDTYYPIFHWLVEDVWDTIKASGVPHHYAYDLGMKRLSCVFCVFSDHKSLLIAGRYNPELLAEYVRIEKVIGHTFKNKKPISDIQKELEVTDYAA